MTFSCQATDDIELLLLEESHAPELFQLADANREYLRKWLPWLDDATSVDRTLRFIKMQLAQAKEREALTAGIWFRKTLCGTISFNLIDWVHRTATIGYWLDAGHQGKGIMTAACRALLDHGFNDLQMHRIVIKCATENLRSRAIPERLGFKLEGMARDAEWLYTRFVDLAIYSKLESEHVKTATRYQECPED